MTPILSGLWLRLGTKIDSSVNARVHELARALLLTAPAGVTDIMPSYTTVYIEYDARRLRESGLRNWIDNTRDRQEAGAGRHVRIPVRYDGPDLADIARRTGLERGEVIRRHAARTYRVHALGFTPGFPFLGEVDPLIRVGRHEVPRSAVPAHSVGIADAQTGIYPLASPGGWQLLGTALTAVYDPQQPEPFLLEPGDSVTFEPSDGPDLAPLVPFELLPAEPDQPVLHVLRSGLLDLVVDRGRFHTGRYGLARSGPLDGSSAAIANRLVGNHPGSALLELNLLGPELEVLADTVLAFAGWGVTPQLDAEPLAPFTSFAVRRGSILRFPPQQRGARGYLAVAGGIQSDTFLNSMSTDVRGLIGRPLRAGDVLGAARLQPVRPGFSYQSRSLLRLGNTVTLRISSGPQATPEALAALTREPFVVQQADRMGLRFAGDDVPGGSVLSEANPLGAIQVTPGGQPLLLLHDRGRLGGYTKPAAVLPGDLWRVGQLKVGDTVRFSKPG